MSLIDDIKINSLSDAQEILKAAGTEDLFEKAHKDGDLHPNGKWVWVSSAGGKGDWRTLNGRTHKKHQSANAAEGGSSVGSGAGGKSSATQRSTKTKQTSTKVKPIKDYFEEIKSALNFKGFDAHLTTNGSIEVYEKGKRKSMKNLKASIQTVDYIDFGPNTNLKDKITSAVKEAIDEKNKKSVKQKTSNSEAYSHDINGVTVNVSKNKDGSYTLEANGKKVKSDDPSFFKDKLLPRVKKALAKELGIEATTAKKTSTKKTTATKSQTFEAKNAADYDKGDGKIGNYPKPETRSLRANAILSMMHNNRHFGFKYGMDTNKIKSVLEASGDKLVTVDMHNNAGRNEIYRIKFGDASDGNAQKVKAASVKKSTTKKIPAGKRVSFEDDVVVVYDSKGKKIYEGILDYCPYKDDNYKWNDTDKNYDLPHGYKMVGK